MDIFVVPWAPGPLIFIPGNSARAEHGDDGAIWLTSVVAAVQYAWVVLFLLGLVVVGPLPPWLVLVAFPGVLNTPATILWRAWENRRARRSATTRNHLLRRGIALNPADPAVLDLVRGFGAVVTASRLPGVQGGADTAVAAAHAALIEVASLLGGSLPAGPDERAFVHSRRAEVVSVATALERRARRATLTNPHEHLAAGSLERLAEVRRQLSPDSMP